MTISDPRWTRRVPKNILTWEIQRQETIQEAREQVECLLETRDAVNTAISQDRPYREVQCLKNKLHQLEQDFADLAVDYERLLNE